MDSPFSDKTIPESEGRYYEGRKVFGGRFVLKRKLGQGGMGQVWLAADGELALEVALKFTSPELAGDTKAVADLRRAVALGRELTHPGIVRVHDFHSDERECAISMEYMPGKNLSEWQALNPNGFFEAEEILGVLAKVCEVLDYAHLVAKRSHRDIKPKNIMFDERTGTVKLADFDIGRRLTDTHIRNTGKEPSGSLPYMGPQQLLGENSRVQDDVYSLGATIYELLTGTPPFHQGDVREQIKSVIPVGMAQRRRDLLEEGNIPALGAPIPASWEHAVAACLAKSREARPASAGAVLAMLQAAPPRQGPTSGRSGGGSATPPGKVTPPLPAGAPSNPPPPKKQAKPILVLLAACAVIGLIAWGATRQGDQGRDRHPGGPVDNAAHQEQLRKDKEAAEQRAAMAEEYIVDLAKAKARDDAAKLAEQKRLADLAAAEQKRAEERVKTEARQLVSEANTELARPNPDLALAERKANEAKEKWSGVAGVDQVLAAVAKARMPVPKALPLEISPNEATKEDPFENSLGMKFVPAVVYGKEKQVLFCIWETRRKDYEAYAKANSGLNDEWKNAEWAGQPVGHEPLHPVVRVSYDDAVAFCKWLTAKERKDGAIGPTDEYRLPSDAEWSYAVGIGVKEDSKATPQAKNTGIKDVYPWSGGKGTWPPPKGAGNYCGQETKGKFGSMIDAYDDGYATTSPVGSFPANANGLFDLGGNVWEWCNDSYDGSSGASSARVLRGGSWFGNVSDALLSSCRYNSAPGYRFNFYGFRVVLVVSAR